MKKIRPSFTPGIIWLIIATVLFVLPGQDFPKENWLDKLWVDKWAHITIFTFMIVLWCWAVFGKKAGNKKLKRIFTGIALLGLCYGVGIEFIQKYFIPNRGFEAGDIIADATGCAIGLIYSIKKYSHTTGTQNN